MVAVYRKKGVIHVERITREKVNSATVNVGIDPSKVTDYRSCWQLVLVMREAAMSPARCSMCLYWPAVPQCKGGGGELPAHADSASCLGKGGHALCAFSLIGHWQGGPGLWLFPLWVAAQFCF